jgi:hypothetical protein
MSYSAQHKAVVFFIYYGLRRAAVGRAASFLTFIHKFSLFEILPGRKIFLTVFVVFLSSHSNVWIYLKLLHLPNS